MPSLPLSASLLLLLVLGGTPGSRGGSLPSPPAAEGSGTGSLLCDYQRCRHLQPPCTELRGRGGCLCPGLSGPGVPPEPPELVAVVVTAAGASLHWCAPASVVLEYHVLVGAPGRPPAPGLALPPSFRLAALGGLRPDTPYVLCIVARNGAGASPTAPPGAPGGPCRTVRTPPDPRRLLPATVAVAGVLGAAGGLALAWHCLRGRRRHPMPSTEGEGDQDRDPPGTSWGEQEL
ncbi:LRRN4 C-terminal-like protein [Apteryx mantelli]|uniref:LRRN4 C-terminal-like protein n=1 Tax=Apteryx mantelli TaxID=2696672 RepID=A0ABM4G0Z7_9AVES